MAPPGPFVRSVLRVGTTTLGLLPAETAIVLDGAVFTLTDVPTAIITDNDGGSVTGYALVAMKPGAALAGGSITLGSQTPPQYMASVGTTSTISTGTQSGVLQIPVPAGHKVQAEFSIQAYIALPTPGILLPASATIIVDAASYGTSGPIVIAETVDPTRSTNASPWIDNTFAISVSGSNLSVNIAAVTPVPFVTGHAYTGGYAGGTTPPNAIGDGSNSLVTNDSGKIYVCVAGGTDSGSGGPTGSSAGDIVVGGLTWRYVAASGSHLTLTYTVCLDGVKTG